MELCPPMPGTMPAQPNFASSHSNRFLFQASKILPSVTDRNPYLKDQVGNCIFDFVKFVIGPEKAPKITGMLIELPVPQIKQFLSSFEALRVKVHEANSLLNETKKQEEAKKQQKE